MKLSKVGKGGRVTIPVELREKWGLDEGDTVAFVETEAGVMLVPQVETPMEALDQIGQALKEKGVTLEELMEEGREIRRQLLKEEYGIEVEDE